MTLLMLWPHQTITWITLVEHVVDPFHVCFDRIGPFGSFGIWDFKNRNQQNPLRKVYCLGQGTSRRGGKHWGRWNIVGTQLHASLFFYKMKIKIKSFFSNLFTKMCLPKSESKILLPRCFYHHNLNQTSCYQNIFVTKV